MRVLMDENMPRKLKYRLAPEHEVVTVPERGWNGLLNGKLLRTADAEFDAMLTMDRSVEYQQSLTGIALRMIVVQAVNNKYETLLPLVSSIKEALRQTPPGQLGYVT